MHVAWLELRDVRCYETLRFEPDARVNILVGDNGEGKTSVLEALGYLGLMKSFRLVGDDALVREGSPSAVIRGGVGGAATEITVECEIPVEGRRTVLVNGKRPQRMRDVHALVPVVAFMPDDLDVVKRGPGLRRDYLDDLAGQLWPRAGADITDYERSLRQRNSLLRQSGRATDPVTLEVWDSRLAAAAAGVLGHRRAVATALQPHLSDSYTAVGGSGDLRWSYRSTWGSDGAADESELAAAMTSALAASRDRDLELRTTTVGPHRDEPGLLLDGRPTRTKASQGEQRTVAIAMRIGAHRVVREVRDVTPILLLDDVFSELDPDRARRVAGLMAEGQVFVTTAREDEVPIDGRRWSVRNGDIV